MVRKLKAKKRTLLVDGDIVCYRIAIGIEEATEWEDDMWTLTTPSLPDKKEHG